MSDGSTDRITTGAKGKAGAPGSAAASLELRGEERSMRRVVTVTDAHSTGMQGRRHLFGGMGAALCLETLRSALGREVSAISVQFLEPTPSGADLVLDVVDSVGRGFVQSRIEGRVDGRPVLGGFGSSPGRTDGPTLPGHRPPSVPPPEACPIVTPHAHAHEDIHSRFEIRQALGRFDIFSRAPVSADGHVMAWIRTADGCPLHVTHLAMMADFLPSTASNSFGDRAGGASLDNNLRYFAPVTSEWALVDLAIRGVVQGVAHGTVEIWGQDGTLAAIGGQSFMARTLPPRR